MNRRKGLVKETKFALPRKQTVFVVKTGDEDLWVSFLRTEHFSFAREMSKATLIIVPGGMRFAEKSVPPSLRSRAVILQDKVALSTLETLKLVKDFGFRNIYFGDRALGEFTLFITSTLNQM